MTDLQSTNRVKIAKVREATFGITPATPAFKAIRTTGQPNLGASPQTVVSSEIRSDRQVADLILVGEQAGGDMPGEMSFNAVDDDLEEALQGTWTALPSQSVTALTATTMTVAVGTTFKANMLVQTTGFAIPANNGLFVVSSSASTSIVFPAASFTAEATPPPPRKCGS